MKKSLSNSNNVPLSPSSPPPPPPSSAQSSWWNSLLTSLNLYKNDNEDTTTTPNSPPSIIPNDELKFNIERNNISHKLIDTSPWWLPSRSICSKLLQAGPIPHHIAFIMDGNRRFAKKMHVDRAIGHALGFDKLEQTLDWCLEIGVKVVTVYAFSIENFKRSNDEVTCLMELAKIKFARLIQESEVIQKHGVSIRVFGDVSLLPEDVQLAIAKAVTLSRKNTKTILNVCFPYTSRHEIVEATKQISIGIRDGLLEETDITEDLFEKCLYTNDAPDLLVRTSGEVRLSDFLMWQTSFSQMYFVEVLWPEFSLWDLFRAMLFYQRNHLFVQKSANNYYYNRERLQYATDIVGQFFDKKKQSISCSEEQIKEREARQLNFIDHLNKERLKFFEDLCHKNNVSNSYNNLKNNDNIINNNNDCNNNNNHSNSNSNENSTTNNHIYNHNNSQNGQNGHIKNNDKIKNNNKKKVNKNDISSLNNDIVSTIAHSVETSIITP